MKEILETIQKYGVNALLVFAILWLNNRMNNQEAKLERVEERLYNCLQNAEVKPLTTYPHEINQIRLVGVLEDKRRHFTRKREVVG